MAVILNAAIHVCSIYPTNDGEYAVALQAGRSRVRFAMGSLQFFSDYPSGRTMALGPTRPLTEMSTRNLSWGKDGRCVGLTTLPPSCADCLEIRGASTWIPKGLSRRVAGKLYLYLYQTNGCLSLWYSATIFPFRHPTAKTNKKLQMYI